MKVIFFIMFLILFSPIIVWLVDEIISWIERLEK